MNIHIKSKKKAFTLVEILVVILIIGLLFVMLVPKISSTTVRAKESGVQTRFNEFRNAASLVLTEHAGLKDVMSSDTDVAGVVKALNEHLDPGIRFDESTITGLYCDNVAKDPWNNKYRLHVKDNTLTFISYGHNNVATHSASDIAAFDFDSEVCDYTLTANYTDGKISISTRGFTKNANSNGEGGNGAGGGQVASTPEDCFTWNGTTILGFSGTCGHTDEEHSSIVIPDRCTAIGCSAFDGCHNLTSVTIPNSVTSIGSWAFSSCTSLTSVTIPNSVTSIRDHLFTYCTSLTSIIIPDSVTSIGESAFSGCTSLTSITIPDSVTSIGESAFRGCASLTSITIPNSVTSIGICAFFGCTSLTSVTIPNSVTSIGTSTFVGCTNLTSVTIPDSVTSIGQYAFQNCRNLTSVTIPNNVTSIGESAFSGCTSLTSITIPDSVTSIGKRAFFECTGLTSVTIPDSVTSIGQYAFYKVPHIEYHGGASGRPWGALSMN